MRFHDKFTGSTKGITPVIATVLLLGITVAIGLTVYTQAQGMIAGGADTSKLDKAQDTEMQLTPVYAESSGGDKEIRVRVTNTGDRAINTSEFSMYFGPPDFPNPVARSALPGDWKVGGSNECLTSGQIVAQGDYIECSTGVKFPGALQSVEVQVRADNFDFSESSICSVESEDAQSC